MPAVAMESKQLWSSFSIDTIQQSSCINGVIVRPYSEGGRVMTVAPFPSPVAEEGWNSASSGRSKRSLPRRISPSKEVSTFAGGVGVSELDSTTSPEFAKASPASPLRVLVAPNVASSIPLEQEAKQNASSAPRGSFTVFGISVTQPVAPG